MKERNVCKLCSHVRYSLAKLDYKIEGRGRERQRIIQTVMKGMFLAEMKD